MAKKIKGVIASVFTNYRQLANFINEKGLQKEDILKIDQKDSQIFMLYYK